MNEEIKKKILDNTREVNGCLEWISGTGNGYGRVRIGDFVWMAHRLSYTVFKGPIPEGMLVCHSCDNPPCVNANHLFLGTCQDNMTDKVHKGRGTRGSLVNTAKLTEEDVADILLARSSGETFRSIASRYGVHWKTISRALSGRTWAHV